MSPSAPPSPDTQNPTDETAGAPAPPPPQHILIIGAGLSGLVLAQALHKHRVPFTVFERDPSGEYRPQGYRIKLPGDVAGLLRPMLEAETWEGLVRGCAVTVPGETLLDAIDGRVLARRGRLPGGMPPAAAAAAAAPLTVDRARLRALLLRGLGDDGVRFGHEFVRYEELGRGRVRAWFADGTAAEGTLLVGADGQGSRVRRQCVPQVRLFDSLSSCIYGKTPISPGLLGRLNPRLREGFAWIIDSTPLVERIVFGDCPVGLLVEAMRWEGAGDGGERCEDYLYWVLVFRNRSIAVTEELLSDLFRGSAKELSLDMTREWDSSLRCVLELQDEGHTRCTKMFSVDPTLPAWQVRPKVTLVGDSIHVMTPTGGVGAVTAIRNAVILAQKLIDEGASAESIGGYEDDMRAYARINLQRSFYAGKNIINQPAFEECKVAAQAELTDER